MTQHEGQDGSAAALGPSGYDVQALVDLRINSVPADFVREAWERQTITDHDDFGDSVPLIDMAGLQDVNRREATMAAIASACQDWGFFQVINHGIPVALLNETFKLAREYFDLPRKEKEAHMRDTNKPVSNGYGRQFLTASTKTLDWHDVFFHYLFPLSLREMDTWPRKPAAYRESMKEYAEGVLELTDKLLEIFDEILGLNPGHLKDVFGEPMLNTRLNFYPACPEPKRVLGLRSHSDPNVMTVLAQDWVGGLQVKNRGRWVGVKPISGALVVNIGDSMQIVSNGRFQSVEHRAVTNQGAARFSMPVFCHPRNDSVLGPASELVDESHPALCTPIDYAAYRLAFHNNAATGKIINF